MSNSSIFTDMVSTGRVLCRAAAMTAVFAITDVACLVLAHKKQAAPEITVGKIIPTAPPVVIPPVTDATFNPFASCHP